MLKQLAQQSAAIQQLPEAQRTIAVQTLSQQEASTLLNKKGN